MANIFYDKFTKQGLILGNISTKVANPFLKRLYQASNPKLYPLNANSLTTFLNQLEIRPKAFRRLPQDINLLTAKCTKFYNVELKNTRALEERKVLQKRS